MEAAKAAFRTLGQADRAAFATFVTSESNPGAGVLESLGDHVGAGAQGSQHMEGLCAGTRTVQLQDPADCECQPALFFRLHGDGFANIVHNLGWALVLAGWSRRTLIATGFFDYTPTGDWTDVFRRPSQCVRHPWTSRPARCGAASDEADFGAIWKSGRSSIFAQLLNSSRDVDYFDVQQRAKAGYEQSSEKSFSARLFVSGALVDDAAFPASNFATRACAQWHLWRPSSSLKKSLHASGLLKALELEQKEHRKYIGFHIRLSDNEDNLMNAFGLSAVQAFQPQRYMRIARSIRASDPACTVVFVTTDNAAVARRFASRDFARENEGWSFHVSHRGPKTNSSEWLWYKKDSRARHAGVPFAVDVEGLYRADYLVGSMSSNVFRLAVELHYASGRATRPGPNQGSTRRQRVFPIDGIPWHQDV